MFLKSICLFSLAVLTVETVWGTVYTVSTNANSGEGSLRQAILDLNSSDDASNTIQVSSGLDPIVLLTDLPGIEKNVDVAGPSVAQLINGGSNQVFFVNSAITASMSQFAISGIFGQGSGVVVSPDAVVTIEGVVFSGKDFFLASGGSCTINVPSGSLVFDHPIVNDVVGSGGGLIKGGSGTLDFATYDVANAYEGGTVISQGTLRIASDSNLGDSPDGVDIQAGSIDFAGDSFTTSRSFNLLGAGAFNVVEGSSEITLDGVVSGSGDLTLGGAGTLIFSGSSANTHTGSTIINAGELILDKTGVTALAGDLQIAGGSLTLNQSNQMATGSTITLSGGALTMGSHTEEVAQLIFTGGAFSQAGGRLNLDGSGDALIMGHANLSGDIYLTGGGAVVFDPAQNGMAVIDGVLDLGGAATTFNIGNGQELIDLSVMGMIANGGVVKEGAGALEFTGSEDNTYTGDTTVMAGDLILNKSGALAVAGDLVIDGGVVIFNGSGQIASDSTITISSGMLDMHGQDATVSRLIFNGGTFSQGGGTLTLDNAASALTMMDGVISGDLHLTGGGSVIFDVTNQGTAELAGALDLGGNETIFHVPRGLEPVDLVLSGSIDNGAITKIGAGILQITGNNRCLGGTKIHQGVVSVFSDSGLGDASGDMDINDATLRLEAPLSSSRSVAFTGASFLDTNGYDLILSGEVSGSGLLTKIGTGRVLVTGTNSFVGTMAINGGVLSVSSADGCGLGVGNIVLDGTTLVAEGAFNSSADLDLAGDSIIDTNGHEVSLSGDLVNMGSFVKMGSNTLILTGNNTNSGEIIVSGGRLQGNTDGLTGTIVNQSSVVFDQTTMGIYAGEMSGSGSCTKMGAGTLILMGANTYTGGTIVSEGVLQGNCASLQGHIVNDASLIFDQSTEGVYAGAISGEGSFTKQNVGALILRGENNYSGGTTVSDGTLQGDTLSLQGDILNHATLVFDQSSQGTYLGEISGVGNFVKQGVGTLILAGNIDQGAAFINEGTLIVNTPLAMPITVEPSAFLGGGGTIIGDVVNKGGTRPGNSIGTLSIVGNYTQAQGSTLEIEISPTATDLLQVSGDVVIEPGSTLVILPEFGTYTNRTYTFITTGGSVSGQFANLDFPFAYNSTSDVVAYSSNAIEITLQLLPFAQLASGKNAKAVGAALDGIADPSTGLQTVIDTLRFLDRKALEEALDQLQPSLFKGLTVTEQNSAFLITKGISHRLEALYRSTCPKECSKTWDWWVTPLFEKAHQHRQGSELGWHAQTNMIIGGGDRVWKEHFQSGAALGFVENRISWDRELGKGKTRGFFASLYSSWVPRWGYVQAILTGGWNRVTASREIAFSTLDETARHHQSAPFAEANGEVGFLLKGKNFQVRPFGSVDYLYIHENRFKEFGAGDLDLTVNAVDAGLLRGEAGANFSLCFSGETVQVVPEVQCSWMREQRLFGKRFGARFSGTDADFEVEGAYPSRNLVAASGGLTANFIKSNMGLSTYYDMQAASGYFNQVCSFEVSGSF